MKVPPGDPIQHAEPLDATPLIADGEPFALFEHYYAQALASEPSDANAAALATVDADGMPDVRVVLVKGFEARAFVFYTHADSEKGVQLRAHPSAALCFHWKSLLMQVRVRGRVSVVTADEADAYFATRPRLSQIGAHASHQSQPLPGGRAQLLQSLEAAQATFANTDAVPRPAGWIGFRLIATQMEFWRSGAYRMHDRLRFVFTDGGVQSTRLQP